MKIALIGPTYPYRGGIAHYTTLLFHAISQENETMLFSFRRQYPRFLFPGKSDREPGQGLLESAENIRYLLDPLNPFTWWKTAQQIKAWGPDLIVMQWWVPFWAPAWLTLNTLLRRWTSARIVFLCHNVLPHEERGFDRWLAKHVLQVADDLIVHSESERVRLMSFLPHNRVVVNPLPTYRAFEGKMSKSTARSTLGIGHNEPVMLFFGFVRPYKGLDILLSALAKLADKLPVILLVVGEFWLSEEEIYKQITKLQLEGRVKIINQYVANEEVAPYFLAADVVVLPYRHATQSAVVQLAFGFERPVITTNVGGLAEAVRDGKTGYVVPSENSQLLAEAIDKFFQLTTSEQQTFQENIRRDADRFAWSRMVAVLKQAAYAHTDNKNGSKVDI